MYNIPFKSSNVLCLLFPHPDQVYMMWSWSYEERSFLWSTLRNINAIFCWPKTHLLSFLIVKLYNSRCPGLCSCGLRDLSANNLNILSCKWIKPLRDILVNPHTHNYLICNLMFTPSLKKIAHNQMISFCCNGIHQPSLNIRFLFKQSLIII